MKCRMMAFHQFASVKHMYRKYISQLKSSRISFLKLFLVPYMYAFTCCNFRVGKFDVSASNMIVLASIFNQAQVNGQWKRIRRLQLVQANNSWNTVIENHSNAKEIWSGHGIQA